MRQKTREKKWDETGGGTVDKGLAVGEKTRDRQWGSRQETGSGAVDKRQAVGQ